MPGRYRAASARCGSRPWRRRRQPRRFPAMRMRSSIQVVTLSLFPSLFFVYLIGCWNRRVLGARSVEKVAAGLRELVLEALHQFGDRRRIGDLADALARAPDVAPRLGLGVA